MSTGNLPAFTPLLAKRTPSSPTQIQVRRRSGTARRKVEVAHSLEVVRRRRERVRTHPRARTRTKTETGARAEAGRHRDSLSRIRPSRSVSTVEVSDTSPWISVPLVRRRVAAATARATTCLCARPQPRLLCSTSRRSLRLPPTPQLHSRPTQLSLGRSLLQDSRRQQSKARLASQHLPPASSRSPSLVQAWRPTKLNWTSGTSSPSTSTLTWNHCAAWR